MKDELILSAYGSHNAAISMYYKGQYTVVEVERWLSSKNIGLTTYMPVQNPQLVFDEITEWLLSKTDKSEVDVYMTDYVQNIQPKFKYSQHVGFDHHSAHAATAFYQSPYKEALVFTFDGGGDGGYFNAYVADRVHGVTLVDKIDQDLGFPYMLLADYLEDIKKESLSIGNLVYAGKLMGLCSYGNVREDWLQAFMDYYIKFNYTGDSFIGGAELRKKALTELFDDIGVEFDFTNSRFSGQLAWDIAATTQRAFEEVFLKFASPMMEKYHTLPICMAGGCALNVLLNTRLLDMKGGAVYVPPNVNDCGISVGGILLYQKPEQQVDLTYSGLPVLDEVLLSEYAESGDFDVRREVTDANIAKYLAHNKIVGLVQGTSEHGSRALGNRSILCNPVEGMKDTINKKVKNREWYRPFAPVVREDETHKYFEFSGTQSRHMTFVAKVRDEWKRQLHAITHQDGTGRLQTVTRQQNPLIYSILGEFGKHTGHSVLLNTSFNVNGKPILTKLSDALHILRGTELDAVYFKGTMFFKRGAGKDYDRIIKADAIEEPEQGVVSVNLLMIGASEREIRNAHKRAKSALRGIDHKLCLLTDNAKVNIPDCTVYCIEPSKLHYKSVLSLATGVDYDSVASMSHLIIPLWYKEFLEDNPSGCVSHVFLDVMRLWRGTLNRQVLLDIVKKRQANDKVGVALSDESVTIHLLPSLIRDKNTSPELVSAAIYSGTTVSLQNAFRNYEGVMLWHASNSEIPSTDICDTLFMSISVAENPDLYEVWK